MPQDRNDVVSEPGVRNGFGTLEEQAAVTSTKESIMKRTISLAATAAVVGAGIFAAAGGLSAASSAASNLPALTLAMNGKTITVGGTLRSGAVMVVSTVTKEAQGNPALFRVDPGASYAKAFAAVKSHGGNFDYLEPYGSLVYSTTVNDGASSSFQIPLQPGTYVAFDAVPGVPHALFTITQSPHPAPLPTPQATLRTIDFAIDGPGTVHDGELVRFENSGFLLHVIVGIAVKNAGAAAKVTNLLKAGKDGQAKRLATGIVDFEGGLSTGDMQQQAITAKPGIYVLLCFLPIQDGREESQLGMEHTIRITK
jgi:hypothetical protein